MIFVAPGTYRVSGLEVSGAAAWIGVPGASVLKQGDSNFLVAISGASNVRFQDITFDGNPRHRGDDRDGLVVVRGGSKQVYFEGCTIQNSGVSGLVIENAACTISNCLVRAVRSFGIVCDSRKEVRIIGSEVVDIGNKGIYITRSRQESVRTVITGNFVSRIKAVGGGDGQNGNGINIFRAHDVLVEGNHITECVFSAVRIATANGCRVIGNHIARVQETACYVEFGGSRTVISSNHFIDCPDRAISITNFNVGGHLAICSGNVITNAGREGIFAEADAIIQGNIIDGAVSGVVVGNGKFSRNVTVDGNLIQDTRSVAKRRLRYGILVSNHVDGGPAFITNNRIFNFRNKAIYGHDSRRPAPLGSKVYIAHNYPGIPSRDLPKQALGGSIIYAPDTGVLQAYHGKRWRRV